MTSSSSSREEEDRSSANTTTTSTEDAAAGGAACFANIPLELFCNVVSYLGPTSSSLCALCVVSMAHNAIMTTIGDAMLRRARSSFRVPLAPRRGGIGIDVVGGGAAAVVVDGGEGVAVASSSSSRRVEESSVSLFVRHARSCKAVHDRLEVLDGILRKAFPSALAYDPADGDGDDMDGNDRRRGATSTEASPIAVDRKMSSSSDGDPLFRIVGSCTDRRTDVVTPSEVGRALNIALCLLGRPDPDYFDDPNEANVISYHASTTALEWRVNKLCGAIGVKSYKYAKSRMCRRYDREDETFFNAYHAVTDRMLSYQDDRARAAPAAVDPLGDDDDESDYYDDDDDNETIDPGDVEAEEDMMLLDKASLVMQHVYLREQDAARRRRDILPP